MGWSSKFFGGAAPLLVQVRLRESGARVRRRKTRRLKPPRLTLAKNVWWGNHKSREWGWKVPYFRDVTWCNHGCWPLTHCQNHGSTTDSLYVWPILAWKNFSCLHFSLAKITILNVDFGMFWVTFSWQVTDLQLILGTKVLVIQRWKSTIFGESSNEIGWIPWWCWITRVYRKDEKQHQTDPWVWYTAENWLRRNSSRSFLSEDQLIPALSTDY